MSGRRSATNSPTRVPAWVRAVPMLAAFAVGTASFTLSFFAQSEVSTTLGAVPARLSWLVPIIIDGGILAGSASVWSSSTQRARKDPVAYLTIVSLLALSVVINVHHASSHGGLLASVIAGAPPVVLLLCLELVARQARSTTLEAREAAPVPVAAPVPAPPRVPGPVALPVAPVPVPAASSGPVAQPLPLAPDRPDILTGPAPARLSIAPGRAPSSPAAHPGTDMGVAPLLHEDEVVPGPHVVDQRSPKLHLAPAGRVAAARESTTGLARTTVRTVTPPRPESQSEQIRDRFAAHVRAGGDPLDSALARQISDELGAPLPSVRRVLAVERRTVASAG